MVVALVGQAPSRGCARCPRARGSPLAPRRPRSRGTRHTSAALRGEASIASSSVCLACVATSSASFACSSRSSCASWLPLVHPIPSDPPITHRCAYPPPGRSSAQGSLQSGVEGVSPQEPMGHEEVMPGLCNDPSSSRTSSERLCRFLY